MDFSPSNPTISIIVPTRNRGDLLRTCLLSLAAQDIDPHRYEIFVCSDGSTEDLLPVVEEFQPGPPVVRLLSQPARGPASARNMGFRTSKAPVYICLDSDMTCKQDFVRRLFEALQSHSEWVAAEGHVVPVDGTSSPLWDAPTSQGGNFMCGATAYRAQVLRQVGGFDESFTLPANEDFEMGIRLSAIGTFGYVPEAVAYHPRRRVTFATFWKWRSFWRFTVIIARRYQVFGVPSRRKFTHHPRLRTALAALVTMPAGRLVMATKHCARNPGEGVVAISHAIFEFVCGLCALPEIMLSAYPERNNYLSNEVEEK